MDETSAMKHCKDCPKKVSKRAKRCQTCAAKQRVKDGVYKRRNQKGKRNPNFGNDKLKGKNNPNFGVHKKGKDTPGYIDGRCSKKHFCGVCGKEIHYTAIHCKQHSKAGKNHPNWKNGLSTVKYPLGWAKLAQQIRKRDDYTCQLCGIPEIECNIKLHVHHIDYDKESLVENNLISLCISCHIKTNYSRNYWKKFFTGLMCKRQL